MDLIKINDNTKRNLEQEIQGYKMESQKEVSVCRPAGGVIGAKKNVCRFRPAGGANGISLW